MDIFKAAELLQNKLRGSPWLTAVAVGGLDEREVIFVYTNRAVRNRELDEIRAKGWMGFEVKIDRVGRAQPALA